MQAATLKTYFRKTYFIYGIPVAQPNKGGEKCNDSDAFNYDFEYGCLFMHFML